MPKVIIADDRTENRFLLINFFKLFGSDANIEIIEADSAKQTIEKIKIEKPDLVLMDIKMETSDAGLNAVKEIRGSPDIADTQIWAITAKAFEVSDTEENYREICINAGFNDYLVKPFDMIELLVKASKCLKIEIPEKTRLKIGIK